MSQTVYVRNVATQAGVFKQNGVKYAKLSGNPFGRRGGPRVFQVIETRGKLIVNLRRPYRK